MIEHAHPVIQALLGTLFTWLVTALGAALVFVVPAGLSAAGHRVLLDASLGFAAGVMLAASYFSLLAPAIVEAQSSGAYGEHGQFAFVPVSVGVLAGGAFVYLSDLLLPHQQTDTVTVALQQHQQAQQTQQDLEHDGNDGGDGSSGGGSQLTRRRKDAGRAERDTASVQHSRQSGLTANGNAGSSARSEGRARSTSAWRSWRRLMLMIAAIVIHNFPEGLAVGVAFGAQSSTSPSSSSFASAVSLTVGIALQNFPEGLAVSLPLLRLGFSPLRSFFYGQLSGCVEPMGGVMGAALIGLMRPLLPYALAFAAGAMLLVVMDDIVPEIKKTEQEEEAGGGEAAGGRHQQQQQHDGQWGMAGAMIGFVVMMSLDVGLAAD